MTRTIIVSPSRVDPSIVRTGTIWYIENTRKVCLIMAAITDSVFNIVFWDEAGEIGDESTQPSMIASDVLVSCAELIAEPLPEFVEMIEAASEDAHLSAQSAFEAKQLS